MRWTAESLDEKAVGVSASRRTDIPALFAPWFENRLRQGFAEYIPLGPPRTIRRSLLPQDVTHFNFWSKWPRPFFRALGQVVEAGYPSLFNVTITGLGGSAVEPRVPPSNRVVSALKELSTFIVPAGIVWRYDPLFLSERYSATHHVETFRALADELAGHVDRVAISLLHPYRRQVLPDLRRYQSEQRDPVTIVESELPQAIVDLARELSIIAAERHLPLTVCCNGELRRKLGALRAGCNSFAWAQRVYPALLNHHLKAKPCRDDCGCSKEIDIGVYDTCTLGCRYSYGSCNLDRAEKKFRAHDPEGLHI